MSLFALVSLIVSISCMLLAVLTFLRAKNQMHRIWGIFNANVTFWCLGLYFIGMAQSSAQALLYWKLTLIPNTFIAVFFYHVAYSFCQLQEKRFLILAYSQAILFSLAILFYKPFLTEPTLVFGNIYYVHATPLSSLWLLTFFIITVVAFYKIWQFIRISFDERRKEGLYLFWSMLIGFGGGYTIALPWYGVYTYPAWHLSICIYAAIFTFAVLRHHFLDIRVGLIRLLIPACIFTVVLFVLCFSYFDMTLFTTASLSVAVLCALLAFIIFAYSTKKIHKIWAFFNVLVAAWGFGIFFVGMSTTPDRALIFWRLTYLPCTFIAVVYYHVIAEFCQIGRPRMLTFAYVQGFLFTLLIAFSDYVVGSTFYIFDSINYHKATFLFAVWLAIWIFIVASAFTELYRFIKRSQGIQKTQALYFFWGMLLGHTGGATSVIPSFNIPLYPTWHFSICIYAAISTYAIFKYQLMDIRVAVARLGVFVVVYSLVLGIPFGLVIFGKAWLIGIFAENWFWTPMLILLVLATAGPFIYLFIQRKAEDALLQEERRIQDLLSRVSVGMRTIRDLSKLSELIVDILIKHLKLDNAALYLYNTETAGYVEKVSEPERINNTKFGKDVPLVRHLEEAKYPVVYEEVKLLSDSEQNGNKVLREIAGQMAGLQASVIVPAMSDNFLLGFIVLGERKDKRLYSVDLINVLSVLGNQAALAIENCHYIQRMQAEGLAERMVSLDHMASSMAHEIDNPMHIIRTSLSFVKSALLRDPRVAMPEEIKQDFDDSLVRSLNASERVSSMIKAILDYSRMGTGKLESIRISDALEGFLQLIHPQIREERVQFTKEIEDNLPPVLGDRVQMEEVFMNFVRNSLHAVRRNEEKKIALKIFRKNETIIRIECSDNGYGIPGEIINDIFLSSMTTKGSTEGTGLGLFRVRKIVDIFRGKVWAESEGKGKGATFIVELPVYSSSQKTQS